jgi:hypothetical protein
MPMRALTAAAVLALGLPAAASAADIAAWAPVSPCVGLQPADVYVPPKTAYIVACTVPLPPSQPAVAKGKHAHIAKTLDEIVDALLFHGHEDVAKAPGPYGPESTHPGGWGNAVTHEGKLVYLGGYPSPAYEAQVRPPVHFLVVPK